MFNLYELGQLTINPHGQKKPEKQPKKKPLDPTVKLRKSNWDRFYEQREEIQIALKKASMWKVSIKYGFCHKTLQRYLNRLSLENNSQVN